MDRRGITKLKIIKKNDYFFFFYLQMRSNYPKLIEGYEGGSFSIYAALKSPVRYGRGPHCYCQKEYGKKPFESPVYMSMMSCEFCGYI